MEVSKISDADDVKMKVLTDMVNTVKHNVCELCAIREEINEITKAQWLDIIKKVEVDIDGSQILLFLGPYSSGKSTFINAILGKKILPTADRPCTSIVTELSFTDHGGHKAKSVSMDLVSQDEEYEDLIKRIDGSGEVLSVGSVSQYHHVELIFDVSQLGVDWEKHPLAALSRFNIKIVDCPGYGALYSPSDNIIEEYIEKASFVFWLSPPDKFGGFATEQKLKNIKKKVAAIIPIITMSDLVNEAKREKIVDEFYRQLAPHFPKNKEPRFVSSNYFFKACELAEELAVSKFNLTKEEEAEKIKVINEFNLKSGLDLVFSDILGSGTKKVATDQKIASALYDMKELLKGLKKRAEQEVNYWKKELVSKGWNEDNQYRKLNEINRKVELWIKSESQSVADSISASMRKELLKYILDSKGNVESEKARLIIADVWENELGKKAKQWAEYLKEEYVDYYEKSKTKSFSSDVELIPPDLGSIKDELMNVVNSVIYSLRFAGTSSIIQAGVGGALIAAAPIVASNPFIGGLLAGLFGFVGPALIIVGLLPLIPIISDTVKKRKERFKEDCENTLRNWIKDLDLTPVIQNMLEQVNTKLYEFGKSQYDVDIAETLSKYERSVRIQKSIEGIEDGFITQSLTEKA